MEMTQANSCLIKILDWLTARPGRQAPGPSSGLLSLMNKEMLSTLLPIFITPLHLRYALKENAESSSKVTDTVAIVATFRAGFGLSFERPGLSSKNLNKIVIFLHKHANKWYNLHTRQR